MGVVRVAQVMGYMNGGGVEQVVMNYYRHIDRSRVQFDFFVCKGSEMIPEEEIVSLGGQVYIVPPYSRPVSFGRVLKRLYLSRRWPIVHSHMNALSVLSLRPAKKAGVPVRIAHSHSTAGKGECAKNVAKRVLKTQSRRYPTHFAACSVHAGRWLFGNETDFCVVPNAIELNEYSFNPVVRSCVRSELGVPNESLVIGHVGRFMAQKNHIFLIQVFSRLLQSVTDAILVLVGEGELRPQIEQAVREEGIESKVLFLGQRNDVASLYQAFDVFAFPSLYEGLGMVLVEAQAAGLPCVASDCVPSEANVSGTVRYLPLGEIEDWSTALIEAGRLGRLGVNCSSRRFAEYNIEVAADWATDWYETHSSKARDLDL